MNASPFQQALGADFANLPDALQQFHRFDGPREFQGRVSVEHGAGLLPALAIKLGGFPAPGHDIPMALSVRSDPSAEHWTRRFGTHITKSKLRFDPIHSTIIERFGLVTCVLVPNLTDKILNVDVIRSEVLGFPLPAKLSLRSESKEWQDDQGRFRFDIAAYFGQDRLLIRYAGWLLPGPRTAS